MADAAKPSIYIDEVTGKDTSEVDGSESKPFQTLQHAYLQHSDQAQYFVKKQEGDETEATYKPAAKAALKKAANYADAQKKKAGKEKELALRLQKEEEDRQKVYEDAKKIIITEDKSLPKSTKIHLAETRPEIVKLGAGDRPKDVDYSSPDRGTRVRVMGRVHRERKQKEVLFVTLRDGHGFMQCVLTGPLAKTYDALTLTRETSMLIVGEMWEVPAGAHAPLNRELHADYFEIIGKGPGVSRKIACMHAQRRGGGSSLLGCGVMLPFMTPRKSSTGACRESDIGAEAAFCFFFFFFFKI